jgi:hypothetical protein
VSIYTIPILPLTVLVLHIIINHLKYFHLRRKIGIFGTSVPAGGVAERKSEFHMTILCAKGWY